MLLALQSITSGLILKAYICKSCFAHRDCPTDFEGIKGLRKVTYAGECLRMGTADGLVGK